jgi:hypothetical protein
VLPYCSIRTHGFHDLLSGHSLRHSGNGLWDHGPWSITNFSAWPGLIQNQEPIAVSQQSLHGRVRHLIPRGHDQRCLALLVHAAEPARVKKPLMPLPVTDAVGLAYLHRHAAARAAVAVAGNYNRLSSFHVPLIFDGTTNLVKSLSLAAVRRSAIAELAGPALEFPGVIERMMLPKFLGRLKAE